MDGSIFNLGRLCSKSKDTRTAFSELQNADDCAILSHTEEALQATLNLFSSAYHNLGLSLNIRKTKLVERRRDPESPSESGSVDRAEVDRHRDSADVDLKSEMEPRREDFSQQPECKAEEVVTEQQLWNQKRNSVLDQEEPEAPQVKEEQEELCISQEGEQLVVKLEADPFMGTLVCEEKQQSEAEPNSEQLLSHNSAGTEIQDEEGSRHVDSGSTKEEEEPKPKKRQLKTGSHSNSDDDSVTSETLCENETDASQLRDCQEEEVLTVQQLCNRKRNSSLDQEEQDAAQVKEEEEELCSMYVVKPGDATRKPEDMGVVTEGQIVLRDLDNVAFGAAMLFGLMYALNLNYPTELKYTFEVLQKVVMEPDSDTLSKKAQVLKNRLHQ
ncbi:uncharacterized protein KZ484_012071 [Pholidichthys leucotaenia]